MRIVNFFDAAQSETVPTIGSLVASNLIVYANDAAYEGGEPGGAVDGSIFYSTDLDEVRVYVNGAWASIVTQADIDAILSRLDTIETDIATLQTDLGTLETNAIQKDGSVTMEADLNIGENAVRRVSMVTDVDDVDSVDPGNRQLISGGNPKLSWGNPGELDAHTSKVINVVDPTDPQDAATKAYVDSVAGAGVSVLNDLTDVDTTGVEDGQALVYDADSSTWIAGDAAGGSGTGGKNYFDAESSDFEKGTIGGWLPYADPAFVNYSLVSADTSTATISDTWWRAQAITLNDEIVTTFVTQMIKFTTPDGDLICEIVNDNAGEPGTTVFASTTRLANDVPASKGTFTFTFTGAPRLTGNFFVRLRRSVGTGGVTNIYSASGSGLYDTLDSGATWSTSANGLQAILNTTQRSASSNITLTANTSNPLAGTTDFSFTKAAVNANGEWAGLFTQTIDRSDRGKVFFGSFSYDATAANYASNDLRVEALDLTSGLPLYMGPSDSLLILKGQGKFDFVVYTEATTEQIEFRIRVNSTNATAYNVFFDEFRLGPAASVNAVYRNEAVLAANGSFTGGTIRVSRVGSQVSLQIVTDLTHASSGSVNSAAGFIPTWARPASSVTNVYSHDSGTGDVRRIAVAADGTLTTQYRNNAGTLSVKTSSGVGAVLSYSIEDTSSQVLTTNELGLQTGAFRASRNGVNQTGVNPNNSAAKILFNSTAAATDYVRGLTYDTTNSRFVCTKSGLYHFSSGLATASTNVLNSRYNLVVTVNGTIRIIGNSTTPNVSTSFSVSVSGGTVLSQGDIVEISLFGAGNNSSSTLTVTGDSTFTYFEGAAHPDFTVLGAVRERNKVQTKILSASVTTNITASDLTFNNLVVGKWYAVSGQLRLIVNSGASDSIVTVSIVHNGVNIGQKTLEATDGTSTQDANNVGVSLLFRAAATTLTFVVSSASFNSFLAGNGTRSLSYIQLEERNDLIETTDFT